MRIALSVFSFALSVAACGRMVAVNDFDASGNPVPEAGPVNVADGGVPGVSRNGWTWTNAGPQAADLYGAWGSAPNDVWFVGAAGVILHWDGSAFTAPDSKTGSELRGVWGSSKTDVWAVGKANWVPTDATILHFDGSAWSVAQTIKDADLYAVSGTSPNDVWAVGGKGLALHFDGQAWTPMPTPITQEDLDGVWASAPNDAWAVGTSTPLPYASTLLRWNGSTWSKVPSPNAKGPSFAGVRGASASDVWFAGSVQLDTISPGDDPNGYLVHWNGSAFDHETILPAFATPLRSVFGTFAVGSANAAEQWNGTTWTSHTLPGDFEATWSSGPNDAWAVGLGGVMAHFDGTSWTELKTPPPVWGAFDAVALWSNAKDDAWIVGNAATGAVIEHWDGASWKESTISAAAPEYIAFYGVWGTSAKDVWGVGAGPIPKSARIVHFDGSKWSVAYDLPNAFAFTGAWGATPNDVWFSGDEGALVHWDGSKMTLMSLATQDQLFAIRGTSASDVWMVGNTNLDLTVRHFDGTSWSVAWTGNGMINSLYVASASDVWGVGWEGSAIHWDGASWSNTTLPREVGAIWGSSGSDIWAVGYFGSVLHYDGSAWSDVPITESDVVGVGGSSASDVWMVTRAGAILHHP